MKRDILLATHNQGKIKEFSAYLARLGWQVQGLPDDAPPVVEDGLTFADNARKKAETMARHFHLPVLADDSGLEVEALHGQPGVHSARYAGEKATDEENNAKLLRELSGVPWERRTARFVCVLALAVPGKETQIFRGECDGRILREPRGDGGFGYDPLFYLPDLDKTMAELTLEEKNLISHRANALRQLIQAFPSLTDAPSSTILEERGHDMSQ